MAGFSGSLLPLRMTSICSKRRYTRTRSHDVKFFTGYLGVEWSMTPSTALCVLLKTACSVGGGRGLIRDVAQIIGKHCLVCHRTAVRSQKSPSPCIWVTRLLVEPLETALFVVWLCCSGTEYCPCLYSNLRTLHYLDMLSYVVAHGPPLECFICLTLYTILFYLILFVYLCQ
jgi:hypothetical protein